MKEKLLIPTKIQKENLKKEIIKYPKDWTPSKIVNKLSKIVLEKNKLVVEVDELILQNNEIVEELSRAYKIREEYGIEYDKYRKTLLKILDVIDSNLGITYKGKVINPKPKKKKGVKK